MSATNNNVSLFLKRVELNQSLDYVRSVITQLNFGTIANLEFVPRINDDGVHIYNAVIITFAQWNSTDNTKYFLEKLAIADRKIFHDKNKRFWYVTQNTSIDTETPSGFPNFPPVPDGSDSQDFIKKMWEENVSLKLQLKYMNEKISTQHACELELENVINNMEQQIASFRTNYQDLEAELEVVSHDTNILEDICQDLLAETHCNATASVPYDTPIIRHIAGDHHIMDFNGSITCDEPDLESSRLEIPREL